MGVLGKFTVKQRRRGGKVALRSVPPRDAPEKVESKIALGKGVLSEKEKFDLCAGLECKFIEAAPTSMCYEPMFTQGTQAVRLSSVRHCRRWGEEKSGFDPDEEGLRIDNLPDPNKGVQTGNWKIDPYGCWWEVERDDGTKFWMIGEYPAEWHGAEASKVAQEYREGELLEDVKFVAEGMDLTIPAGTVVKIFPWEEMEDFYVIEYEGDAFSVEKSKIKIVTGPQPLEVYEASKVAQEGETLGDPAGDPLAVGETTEVGVEAKKVFAQDDIDHVIQGLEDEALDSLTRKVEEGDRFYDVGEGLHFVIGAVTGDDFSGTWVTGVYSGLVFEGKVSVLLREVDEGNIERTARTIFAQDGVDQRGIKVFAQDVGGIEVGSYVTLVEDLDVGEIEDRGTMPVGVAVISKGTEVFVTEDRGDTVLVIGPFNSVFPLRKDQVSTNPPSYYRIEARKREGWVAKEDLKAGDKVVLIEDIFSKEQLFQRKGTELVIVDDDTLHFGRPVVRTPDGEEFTVSMDQIGKIAQVPEDEIKPSTPPSDRTPGGFSKNMSWEEVQEFELHSDLYDSIEEAQNDLSRFEMTHGVTPAIVFCYDEEKYAIVASLSTKKLQAQELSDEDLALVFEEQGDWLEQGAAAVRKGDYSDAERILDDVYRELPHLMKEVELRGV